MKKIIFLFSAISFLIFFTGCSYIYQYEEAFQETYNSPQINITVDKQPVAMGKPLEHIDGYVFVPMKEFSKLIGAEIYWDDEAHTALSWRGDYYIEFCMGEQQYRFGTTWEISEETLDIAPRIIDDVVYVPLRTMAEKLDFSVIWEEDTKTIALTDKETEVVLGYASTPQLLLDEIGKNVKNANAEFIIITENLPIEALATDIIDSFDDVKSLKYVFHEMEDGKTSVTYKVDYHMHTRIIHAHRNNNTNELDEYEMYAYEKALQVVSEHTTTYMTDYEKELSLHDYIVRNTQYSHEALEAISRGEYIDEASTPYGALINGSAICGGYSSTFKLLLELSGIECDIIYGTADEEKHAWNRVKLADKYYLVDVTWNDPDYEYLPDFVDYDYFNITDEDMNQDHIPTSKTEKIADSTFYNYYYYNKLLIENQNDFDSIIKRAIEANVKFISVKGHHFDVENLNLDRVFFYYPSEFEYRINESKNTLIIILK